MPSAKITKDDTFSIVSDYIGKPIAVYNGVGNLVWDVEYDIYGNIRSQSKGDKDFIPFRNQGQYEDSELNGLMYNRFRYYDGNSGTYISQDPIRLLGGSMLYSYVNDTNSNIDIFGHKDCFADAKGKEFAESIIKKHGGEKVKDGHYKMPNRRAARQAASEIAGDLGNNPKKVTKGDFRGGPRTWKDNPSKIGQYSQDKSSGWRDDILGHDFGDEKIGSHVNAWNNDAGVFDNLHLLY